MPLSNGGKTFPRNHVRQGNCCLIWDLRSAKHLRNRFRFNQLAVHEPDVTRGRTLDDVAEGLRLPSSPLGIRLAVFKLLILKGIEVNLKAGLAIRTTVPMAVACPTGMPC